VKRRRATPAQRLRPFWFLIVIVIALLALGTYGFSLSHTFYPHTIDVAGNHVVSKDAILEAAQIKLDRNIWLQNTGAMQQRIAAIPYIDTARVHRHFPGTISIDVTERAPFAVLDNNGTIVTIDRTLRELNPGPPLIGGQLPTIIAATHAVAVILADTEEMALQTRLDVSRLQEDKYGGVVMTLRGSNVRVLFGDPDSVDDKIQMIVPILDKVDRGSRKVAAIDLRAATTPVVEYVK
jgi:cell division septal protein FtsQ